MNTIAKAKTKYVCQTCGNISYQWLGKCPECEAWNSFLEEIIPADIKTKIVDPLTNISRPQKLAEINIETNNIRTSTTFAEVDRVLGGGLVAGEVILLGGDPGIGKSTLSLQIAGKIPNTLYISGEESIEQLKLRANRLNIEGDLLLLNAINVKDIEVHIKKINPPLVIIDSIQTIYYPEIPSSPGSVTQVRESAAYLIRFAKSLNIPIIFIGHITKEGSIAGPKILEHLVDGVFYFEGNRKQDYRILRAVKNRYGTTDEIGVFEMTDTGLAEVADFSTTFINKELEALPGTVITSAIEGSRSFLVEIQALVSPTSFSMPKRVFTGVDANRVAFIYEVL